MPDDQPARRPRRRRTNAELNALDDAIIAAVEADRPVSLRGVFYRVVSAGAVEKTDAGYGAVQRALLRGRRHGYIDYADIVDGSRHIHSRATWDGPQQALRAAALNYRRSLWPDQGCEVRVFAEKDAIRGILQPVTDSYDVPLGIARGYGSETFAWRVAQSIIGVPEDVEYVWLYQLGDHDASGVDGWRAFVKAVTGFVAEWRADAGSWLHFERLAVTPAQISELELPTRPGKPKDPRNKTFKAANRAAGLPEDTAVEVDAIPAPVLRQLVEDAITAHIDPDILADTRETERLEQEVLTRLADRFTDLAR